jgi:flagellar biosynthetic protein FlhB
MAENDQAQEKTEEPTQRRLEKAREDGDVLSSKETFVFATSLCGLLIIASLGLLTNQILDSWAALFSFSSGESLQALRTSRAWDSLILLLIVSAVFGVPTLAIVAFAQAMVGGGLQFNLKSIAFKPEKIDPIKGLGRIFGVKGLVELLKSVAKVGLLTSFVIGFLWFVIPNIVYLSASSLIDAVQYLYRTLMLLMLVLVLILGAIGLGDYLWSRHSRMKKLRMSQQDLKDEYKETEGSPEVKSRMRRLQMEASQRAMQQSAAVENVKDATVIITNPTHFAVALKYQHNDDAVPIILAMGKDILAQRIIEKAAESNKTVVRVPVLARALYFTGDIGAAVTEQLYSAVATILAYVYQLEQGIEADLKDVEIPNELIFDETGKVEGS